MLGDVAAGWRRVGDEVRARRAEQEAAAVLSSAGAVVADPGPVGARAGLRKGDVIAAVNEVAVAGSQAAAAALKDARRWLALEVMRGPERLNLRFRL